MHKFLKGILLSVLMAMPWAGIVGAETASKARPGVVRVKLQSELADKVGSSGRQKSKGTLATGVHALDQALDKVKGVSIEPLMPYSEKFAARRARYGLDRWYEIRFDETFDAETARRILATVPGVQRSENIVPMQLIEGDGKFVTTKAVPSAKAPSDLPFNDPRLPDQWHYKNYGNIGNNVAGADINLFEAWKVSTGSPEVIVAIIDGGIDYRHEDLAANMWVNEAELNGTPGVDDDGNGFVDDIYGYNFCANSGEVYPHSHGTHVAGTVAAVNNNGLGVSGVAGGDGTPGSGVRLMSCQVFESRSGFGDGDFARAIIYAAENGASIAQCSWGWPAPDYCEQAVLDAIDYFTDTARSPSMTGGLCIFASGNMGETGNYYPACYDKVLAVSAMTGELRPASYSNYGPWVDLIAPGGLLDYGEIFGVLSTLPNNQYGYNEGTSMATPHVSGIAALVLSKYGKPAFVSESLRTQLETSVNDFYAFPGNEQFRGQYGVGYIDAGKALKMGQGQAPEAVSDFLADAAQDYILLEWTVPASEEGSVHHHLVYCSETPFTASDLSNVPMTVADTKFLSSGDRATYTINNLKPLTSYYVALQAVDRWGLTSALSPVKQVKTNEGPSMTLDATQLNMTSVAGSALATASFNIGNTAAGLLNWNAYKRTVKAVPSATTRPTPGAIKPYGGTLGGDTSIAKAPAAFPEYQADEYPKDFSYIESPWAYIGDTDRSLPNSMAQWFKVDASEYPEGFHLTHLLIGGIYGQNPVIQIYKGDASLAQSTLLQTVSYSFFVFNYPLALEEQLFFQPGESFWVVVHFAGNQEGYPLGMSKANRSGIAPYSFMSNDMGRTWTQLSAALKGSVYEPIADEMTWSITARSANPDWSSLLDLTPSQGTVRQGQQMPVEVSADGTRLVNGTYRFNVMLETNEASDKLHALPVDLTVTANSPDVVTPRIVDFGSVLVGQSKTLTVEVYNRGYGSFIGSQYSPGIYSDKIESSSEHFKGPGYVSSGFPARTKVTFDLTYRPQSAGPHSGNIVFTDKDGNKVRIVVQGVATEPSKLTVEPSTVNAGVINTADDPAKVSFKIGNKGKYPLEFVFPKFSDETIAGQTAANHKYGYTISSTLEGYSPFGYDGNPSLIGATDLTSTFSDAVNVSEALSPGFSFPFFGKKYDKVYITTMGGILLGKGDVSFWSPLTPSSQSLKGLGFIAAYGNQLRIAPDTKIEYAKADGKFVVNFKNVLASVYDSDYTPISFHITLSSNGDIEIFYDSYDPDMVFQDGANLYCGVADPDLADCLTVTNADMSDYWGTHEPTADNRRFHEFCSGTAVRFEAPKASFVQSLNVPYGIVNPDEELEVVATVAANDGLVAGPTFNNLAIVTNDPAPSVSAVRIEAVIEGSDLLPVAALERENIDLGNVFRTSTQLVPVTLKNTGRSALTVTSVATGGKMNVETAELPLTVAPGSAKDFVVTVPTDTEGTVADEVTIATDAGTLKAAVKANVTGCPVLELSADSFEETVNSGEALERELTVTNSGNETLYYAITPDPLVKLTLPANDGARTDYTYSSSIDDKTVKFEWVDIETNGKGEQHGLNYYLLNDYIAVDLPFEFPFYGEKYTRMYIYNTGFVSFTQRPDGRIWPEPPADFPAGTAFTNIIAPYWGLHSMDQTRTAGTFHYVTADRAVVSFMEYGNSMNFGVCFQLILHKDGSFKFQYKAADENAQLFSLFGLAGISDLSAEQYIHLPERMVTFGQAVQFSPVVTSPLEAGKSDKVGMTFDTNRMGGSYNTALRVSSNQPGREHVEIPLSLTVLGHSEPVWPGDIEVEHTIGYMSDDYDNPVIQLGAMYDAPFTVANSGTAEFVIAGAEVGGPTIFDEDFGWEDPGFYLFVNTEGIDWITGEPTGVKEWQMYNGMPITVGSDPVEFSVPMLYPDFANVPGEYEVPVTFYYADSMEALDMGEFGEQTVMVKFIVTQAPALTLSEQSLYAKSVKETDLIPLSFLLGNEGEYKLDYTLRLDPTGVGEEGGNGGGGGVMPLSTTTQADSDALRGALTVQARPFGKAENAYDGPSDFEYLDALFYPASPVNPAAYVYGTQNLYEQFRAATAFVAPEGGFNMSHLYMPVTLASSTGEYATDYNVNITLVQGPDPEGTVILGRGRLNIASQESPEGRFYVIPLDKSVYLNEGEEFCVVATFDPGVTAPAYLVTKEEGVVEGRYMGYTETYGWFDIGTLFKDQTGSIGYIMTCLETVEGQPWITFDNTATEGSVAPGKNTRVTVLLNPAAARMDYENTAVIVIKSNDPEMPLINYPVVLDKNAAPMFFETPDRIYTREGETATVTLSVTEPDCDEFTLAFSDGSRIASLKSVVPTEGDMAMITVDKYGVYTIAHATDAVTATVVIAPDFGDASNSHAFTLTAADIYGNTAEATVAYVVEHVNRAPVAEQEEVSVEVPLGGTSAPLEYASLFSDPDGDELAYEFNLPVARVTEAYTTPSGVIFYGKAKGETKATVTASDPAGETVTTTVKVIVKDVSAVDSPESQSRKLTVMPNPVESDLNAFCTVEANDVRFYLYDAAGKLVAETTADTDGASPVVISMAGCPAGNYVLVADTGDATLSARVIKR